MIKEQIAAYELILDMIKGKTGHLSKVTYIPQKPHFPGEMPCEQSFLRSTPEEQGISSSYLAAFLQEVAKEKKSDIHGIMIVRNGHVIGEYSFAPYRKGIWHIEHSLCKSITGMAIGLLIAEGKLSLEDKLVKLFPRKSLLANVREKNITIQHLLTMSSGVAFNELGIVSGDDWVKSYLDSTVTGPPGVKFEYNSLNTYMLSAIVTEVTGESMADYLTPRLFAPLGITRFFWENCPKGITKGGWGLFLRQEDAAKLGQLYLDKGKWKGTQIIPEEWVENSTAKHIETPPEMGNYGYGYQIWRSKREGSFNFNGMLGQNVLVYPDLQMVLVLNGGSDELFQNCALLRIVQKYFEEDFHPKEVLPKDSVAYGFLQQTAREMELGRGEHSPVLKGGWKKGRSGKHRVLPGPESQMRKIAGKLYELSPCQAGIFPLIMQVFHNNFTEGISRVGFSVEKGKNYLLLYEGQECLRLEIGLRTGAVSEISVHGEPYLVSVKGEFQRNEDNQPVLKLNIAYLEEAARRKIKIVFLDREKIRVYFDETPGENLIMEGLSGILQAATEMPVLKNLTEFGNLWVPGILIDQTICPVIEGRRVDSPGL